MERAPQSAPRSEASVCLLLLPTSKPHYKTHVLNRKDYTRFVDGFDWLEMTRQCYAEDIARVQAPFELPHRPIKYFTIARNAPDIGVIMFKMIFGDTRYRHTVLISANLVRSIHSLSANAFNL